MSDLLNKASLVLVPSGYKEDTVYSVVPSDGSGDLSFTRASNGTRINSAGLVEVCPWNLLQQSETIGVSPWSNSNLTITANSVIAPNGTTTADVLTETTATTTQFRTQQTTPQSTNIYTLSVYVKNITGTRQAYIDLGPVTGFFNFATETIYSASAIGSFEKLANGWYRIALTTANAITPSTIYMGLGQSNSETYTGNGTSAIAFWGAQLNIGSTAKPYFPTTDRLNVPRLTYQNGGGGCPSLLLEKQSTNSQTYSEQIDNGVWGLGAITISANNTTSPDGTQNADKVVETATTARHELYGNSLSFNGNNAISFYAKYAGRQFFCALGGGGGNGATFDLVNGTVATNTAVSASIESVGNGWYRCIVIINFTGTNQMYYILRTTGSVGIETYTGDGTSGVYFWGAQTELNSSYPTSYIPTTSSSATRVADACYKTGISSLIGQTEGTMFADFVFTNNNTVQVIMCLHDNADNKRVEIWANASSLYGFVGGSSSFNIASITATSGTRYKVAVAYKSGDSAYYVNGTQIGANSTTFTISLTSLIFNYWASSYPPDTKINEAIIFPTRLTNAELASLTTI